MKSPGGSDSSDVGSRIAALEADMRAMTRAVKDMAESQERFASETRASIAAARTEIIAARTTPWGNIIAAAGLSIVVIGAIGASFIAPLNIAQSYAGHERDKLREDLDKANDAAVMRSQNNRADIEAIRERFKEIETQFRLASQIENLRSDHEYTLFQMLWNETHTVPMPQYRYWPSITPNSQQH